MGAREVQVDLLSLSTQRFNSQICVQTAVPEDEMPHHQAVCQVQGRWPINSAVHYYYK